MSEAQTKKLAIIDGKSVFYRGYYAMPNLSTKDGIPTGGVYGFAAMALELVKRLKPDYVAVAWDKPKTNIRKRLQMYPQYKAGRKSPPADFYEQIPILHELLDAFGWPLYELDDYEADDIMGALAVQARKKGIETLLITSDLDALQLVNGNVSVYALKKGFSNIELYKPDSFTAKYGLKPEQFLDLKALKGDSSDNIPGVPGIGEKTAIELLKQYKTLDNVYDQLALVKDNVRKKLEAGKELAYLSKQLAAIWTDAPVKLNIKEVDGRHVDPVRISDILHRLEFRTLLRQLPETMQAQSNHQLHNNFVQGPAIENIIIDTDKGLDQLIEQKSSECIIYSRAAGKHGRDPQILIIGTDQHKLFTISLDKISPTSAQNKIGLYLKNARLIGYDVKSTLEILLELEIQLPPVGHDVLVGAFLLNSLRREQTLSELSSADLGYEGVALENLPTIELAERAGEIVGLIRALYLQQANELQKVPKLDKLAKKIEWPIIPVLARMEFEGIRVDVEYLKKMSDKLEEQISDVQQQIYGFADQEFNIASPAQLSDILFTKMSLPRSGIKRGKTGYSTAVSELDKLRGVHPIIDLISEYRELTKLKNTYVDTLPKQIDKTSRLHTTFTLTVAQTGRLSSNDPNLQNIPVRTDLGKQIRTAFVAGQGKNLVSADYSQFELRIAAYLSEDEELIRQFNDGVDVHTMTAAQIYGRNPEDISKNMRRDAKVVNFGVMYGLSPHGLMAAAGMTYEQAKHFIEKYFEVRPKLRQYIDSIKEQARTKGYVETIFGRRRPTPDVNSSNFVVREAAMRAAVNMPFQGSAADIMKLAMIEVDKKLLAKPAKMLVQIHDSILVECPEEEVQQTAALLKHTMENVVELPIKMTVDTVFGRNWGEL